MSFEISFPDILPNLLKICKENEYNELQAALHRSYTELIRVEADARRQKASGLIRGMQAIDRELKHLEFEYEKTKRAFNIDGIPYFDKFITEMRQKRRELALLKDSLK